MSLEYKSEHDLEPATLTRGDVREVEREMKGLADHVVAYHEQTQCDLAKMREKIDGFAVALKRPMMETNTMDTKMHGREVSHATDPREGKAWLKYVRDDDMTELKSLSVGSDPDGGYLVPPTLNRNMQKVLFDRVVLRQLARVVEIKTDALEEPWDRTRGTGAQWVSETGTRGTTATPQVAMVRVPTHEIYAMPAITQKLIDDGMIDVEAWLAEKIGEDFGLREGAAFVTGTGVGTPRGFLDYPLGTVSDATRGWGTWEYVPTGVTASFGTTADALLDCVSKLKTGYRRGAAWLMNRDTENVIRKIKTTTNEYVWSPSLQLGQPASLLGYPVYIDENMPAIGTNTYSVGFGSWMRGYTIIDRIGIRLLRDPYTAKPNILLYTTKRVGGDAADHHALKFIRMGTI